MQSVLGVSAPASRLTRLAEDDLTALLTIRHFELTLLDLYAQGAISGTAHTCLGQEYIPVALLPLLEPADFVFSNHRGHGHYLGRFDDPAGLLAEVMGRDGAVCLGVGGSQHILRDRYMSTGVQGESLPVAAGAALHFRRSRAPHIAVAFIGDGTWGEGDVYEALNMAALWRLPLAVVVENNGIAQSTPVSMQMAGSIGGRAAAFGIEHLRIECGDVNLIRAGVAPLLERVRTVPGPVVIEFVTRRLGPHSKGDDTREASTLDQLREADWYTQYPRHFPGQFAAAEAAVRRRLDAVVRQVRAREPARWTP